MNELLAQLRAFSCTQAPQHHSRHLAVPHDACCMALTLRRKLSALYAGYEPGLDAPLFDLNQ